MKLGLSRFEKNTDGVCLRTGCWGEYLDLRGMKWQKAAENCIERSSIICTTKNVIRMIQSIKEDEMGITCSMHDRDEKCVRSFCRKK
jgi:hypothetical protein